MVSYLLSFEYRTIHIFALLIKFFHGRPWAGLQDLLMSSDLDDQRLTSIVRDLFVANSARIFASSTVVVDDISVEIGRKMHAREDIYHRPVLVRGATNRGPFKFELWLKWRPSIATIFPLLAELYQRLGSEVFPRPFFAWRSHSGADSFLLLERVDGRTLRNKFLQDSILRLDTSIDDLFYSSGEKMRRFHDTFKANKSVEIRLLFDNIAALVSASNLLNSTQKLNILFQLRAYFHDFSDVKTLPVVKIHHDWTLRNILIDQRKRPIVIDFDSMQAPDDLRWYDVGCFLLNVESQLKWTPLVSRRMIVSAWKAFWMGYMTATGSPDDLSKRQIAAILYLVRVSYLVGGTFRRPYIEKFTSPLSRRFIKSMLRGLEEGRYSYLERDLG